MFYFIFILFVFSQTTLEHEVACLDITPTCKQIVCFKSSDDPSNFVVVDVVVFKTRLINGKKVRTIV